MSRQLQEDTPLMQVERLGVTFYTPRGVVRAVREASLEVRRGELVGLAGETGCGKSTTAFAIVGYLPGTAQVDGSIPNPPPKPNRRSDPVANSALKTGLSFHLLGERTNCRK